MSSSQLRQLLAGTTVVLILIAAIILTRSGPTSPEPTLQVSLDAHEPNTPTKTSSNKAPQPQNDNAPAPPPSNNAPPQESLTQLAEIAQQANQRARGNQQNQPQKEPQKPLNAFDPIPDPDHDHANEPPPVPMGVLMEALDSLRPDVHKCYQTLQNDFPEASGKVHITFVFQNEGDESRVQMAEIDERTTLFDRGLHDCMSEAVSQLTLPKTPNDTRMIITNAYRFTPKPPQ